MAESLLIIDDDVRLADMVHRYLTENGFSADVRHTGAAGIAAATGREAGGRGYGAIILDVMLPDMDGLEVCRRLRATIDTPILMLTARGQETDRIVGLELGADDYLPKPFAFAELVARIRALARRSRPPVNRPGSRPEPPAGQPAHRRLPRGRPHRRLQACTPR